MSVYKSSLWMDLKIRPTKVKGFVSPLPPPKMMLSELPGSVQGQCLTLYFVIPENSGFDQTPPLFTKFSASD